MNLGTTDDATQRPTVREVPKAVRAAGLLWICADLLLLTSIVASVLWLQYRSAHPNESEYLIEQVPENSRMTRIVPRTDTPLRYYRMLSPDPGLALAFLPILTVLAVYILYAGVTTLRGHVRVLRAKGIVTIVIGILVSGYSAAVDLPLFLPLGVFLGIGGMLALIALREGTVVQETARAGTGRGSLLLGALLIHPALFLIVFVGGAIFGAGGFSSAGSPAAYGVAGGGNAVGLLLLLYLGSLGLAPLVISAGGAGAGWLIDRWFRKSRARAGSQDVNPTGTRNPP